MKDYAKIGNKRKGMPAYRTPASFRIRKCLKISKLKIEKFPKAKLK